MNEISSEYLKAQELDRRIKTSAQLAQQSLYDMCMGFKEMRDSKLYKELGYTEFGDYCEKETGFSRMNVYNYISIAEKLPKDFVNSSLQIGVKKLTLLSKLSEDDRTEITETTDLENTTVKELEQQIKELKIKADRADVLDHRLDDMNRNCEYISSQRDKAEKKIAQLEAEIKELESRPIEVAVETDSKEVANLKDAMNRISNDWSEKYSQLEEQNIKDRRELLQKIDSAEKEKQKLSEEKEKKLSELKAELEKTKAEYEKKLSEKPAAAPADDSKTKFKIYLTSAYDSLKRLTDFTKSCGEKAFADKVIELVSAVKNDLEVQK